MKGFTSYILLFFFLGGYFTSNTLTAQLVQQEWVARYQGPSNDLYGPFLALDNFGNSFIAGTHVVNDTINILCVKYNTSGVQQWATLYKYPGGGYFAPTGLALDSSGNAYVISIYGPGFTSPLNGFIVKFNGLNGSPVWAKTYNGEYGWSSFLDIKIDRQNNIYAAGWSDTSHLVIRYNTNGDSVWVRKYHPPSKRESFRACTIDDSLNIILTGHRWNEVSYDTLLVAKYSSSGVLRWESTYAYSFSENVGTKIVADQSGSVYIGGITVSGSVVYLTLKYDRNGAQQWTAIYDAPGSGNNNLAAIAFDRVNSALFVTGIVSNINVSATTIKYNASTGDSIWVKIGVVGPFSNSGSWDIKVDGFGNSYITGAVTQGSNPSDFLTLKYSPQGNQIWFITYNGPFGGSDGGRVLSLDTSNNVYVLGYSQSSSQVSDYVVIKYSQLVGIRPVSNEIPKTFRLYQNYPNPFNPETIINYELPIANYVKLIVYDILGREIATLVNEKQHPGSYNVRFDGSNYSSGVYFYKLITDGNVIDTKKLVISK
jgi:type IX secretion system substrate protein